MNTVRPDPLHALSLARTALSDPPALPSGHERPGVSSGYLVEAIENPAGPKQVAYAMAQIDHAINGLYFEPLNEPARDAAAILSNIRQLLSAVADGLDETQVFDDAVMVIRESVARLVDAKSLLLWWSV